MPAYPRLYRPPPDCPLWLLRRFARLVDSGNARDVSHEGRLAARDRRAVLRLPPWRDARPAVETLERRDTPSDLIPASPFYTAPVVVSLWPAADVLPPEQPVPPLVVPALTPVIVSVWPPVVAVVPMVPTGAVPCPPCP